MATFRFVGVSLLLVIQIRTAFGDETAGSFEQPRYTIYRAVAPVMIDGQLDEDAWQAAPVIEDFHFTWYESGVKETSTARILWDDTYLYVAHVCEDAWIAARCREHDGPVARDDCFEVMLAPDVEQPNVYFNIEWNVLGAWVDNHRPHGPKQPKAHRWDAEGVKIAGTYEGSLNDDTDRDVRWTCEVAIPFTNFTGFAQHTPPRPGDAWNLNLNRHGGDTNLQYSQWSPADTPRPSFHTPHRFGRVTFSDKMR
ncbi:MAG: carbohydrate-binding family 9-like protein [Planctomycetaceae bacterium]|nr:carbohydrate-binding family 9-like protein [Planctomycetaceae bacterium]